MTNGRLGPVASDESPVPPQDGLGSHDQEHIAQPTAIQRPCQHRQDRTVRVGEPRAANLTTQNEELVTQGQDLRVTRVAGREQPSEPAGKDSYQRGEHRPRSARRPARSGLDDFSAPTGPEASDDQARTTSRHLHAEPSTGSALPTIRTEPVAVDRS